MAEPSDVGVDRRLLYVTAAIIVVVAVFLVFSLRSCSGGAKGNGYTAIYSDLDLKDAANVVARLKELKVPYELKDEGRTVAVPKDKAADARLGLAEKNLPLGGVVGWEIFDESKLGATDFERRVQFIRAISGELNRTIRRIEAIEDCRVQIVIPETRLFEVTKTPVTASVLLRMKPGMKLKTSQIKGIINLVASSVENLKPENVTIVDDNGNILSTIVSQSLLQAIQTQTIPSPEITPIIKVITVETTKVATNTATKMVQKVVSEEERTLMKLKVVKETEEHYESLAQSLINRFYPPNSALIKVSLVLGGKNGSIESYDVKRVTAIVLVDNRFNLTPGLKQDTFTIVSQAIGYNEKRGDRIFIRKVPFQFAMTTPINPLPIPTRPTGHKLSPLRVVFELINWSLVGAVLVGLIFVMLILRLIRGRGKKQKNPEPFSRNRETAGARKPETAGAIDDFRALANAQPEKVADLLKSWLTENK